MKDFYTISKKHFYPLNLKLELCESEDFGVEDLNSSGIFAVRCMKNGRLLLCEAENVLFESSVFFQKVREEKILNTDFLQDLKMYGEENFTFLVLILDFMLETKQARENQIFLFKAKDKFSRFY